MSIEAASPPPFRERFIAGSRRFFRWLTKPQVVLALIMLAIMFYMVIIPLYKLVETTVTYQQVDESRIPGAEQGEFTLYHWIRMMTGIFGKIYTLTPLQHSMTIAIGAVALAFVIGGSLAWLQEDHQPTGCPALHHALLDAGTGLAGAFQEPHPGWCAGFV